MSGSRPKLIPDDTSLDLGAFKPKAPAAPPSPTMVKQVAEEGGFPSRTAPAAAPLARQPLLYRTGRTASISVKTTPAAVEAFYDIARQQRWKAGETFETAVEMLKAVRRPVWLTLERLAKDTGTPISTLVEDAIETLVQSRGLDNGRHS